MDSTQVEEGLLSFFLDFSIFYQKFTMNFQISGRFYFEKLSKMTKYWMNIMPYFKNLHSTELPTTENFRVTKLNTSGAIEVLPLQKLVLFFSFKYLKRLYSYFVVGTEAAIMVLEVGFAHSCVRPLPNCFSAKLWLLSYSQSCSTTTMYYTNTAAGRTNPCKLRT